jgi:hypothetical protein
LVADVAWRDSHYQEGAMKKHVSLAAVAHALWRGAIASNARRLVVFRSHVLALAIALSPVLLLLPGCGSPDYLSVLSFEVGGQDLIQNFDFLKYEGYGVTTTSSTATLTAITRQSESTATYSWVVGGEIIGSGTIGVAGGTVTLNDIPFGQSQLYVYVHAVGLYRPTNYYRIDINRVAPDYCVANSTGDPHLITFDRLHYNLQTVGEYILTRSTLGGFEVQARTSPWGTSRVVSVNIAFAADIAGDIVSVYLNDPHVYINHQPMSPTEKVDLDQGGSVEVHGTVTELVWPNGERAQITRYGSYLNLQVMVPTTAGVDLVGLFGRCDDDATNDLWPRDATSPLQQPVTFNELYYVFGDSWRVMAGESLFEDQGVTDPSFPDSSVTSADLPQSVRDDARAFCLEQGVTDGVLLEDCILDYGLTGDESFVEVCRTLFPPVNPQAESCLQLLQQDPIASSGIYNLDLGFAAPLPVYCDMETEGGGWTLVASMSGWNFCGGDPSSTYDLLADPTKTNGKIPDAVVEQIRAASGQHEVMYYLGLSGRSEYLFTEIQSPWSTQGAPDLTHCTWTCADGNTDSTTCAGESRGCGLGGSGTSGDRKKLYMGFNGGLHSGGGFCGLDNRLSYPVKAFVR